jgi:hypothetical protein
MDRQALMDGLAEKSTDPVVAAAIRYISGLENVLEIVQFELSPGLDAARQLAPRVRAARRALNLLPLIGSPDYFRDL